MTDSPEYYYKQGDIAAAVNAIVDDVRNNPSDTSKRVFLAELLCFSGDFDRADKQLNIISTLDTKTAVTVSIWRQLIRAAQSRCDVYNSGAVPEIIETPTPQIKNALNLLLSVREKNGSNVSALLENAYNLMSKTSFVINDQAVDDWRDLDDVHANILEVLGTNGKYFWVDYKQIVELHFSLPERPLDILWRKATLVLTTGSKGDVFIPSIYPMLDNDDATKLGRKTDWLDIVGIICGQGLRTWLVNDEALSIMEINSIVRS